MSSRQDQKYSTLSRTGTGPNSGFLMHISIFKSVLISDDLVFADYTVATGTGNTKL